MENSIDFQLQKYLKRNTLRDVVDSDEQYERICELVKITKEDGMESIRVIDQDEENGLILLHYVKFIPSVYHVRGIIIDLESERIICQSFPFTEEIPLENLKSENWLNVIYDITSGRPLENMIFSKAYEGTILRLFYHERSDKWHLSTHKKLDGRDSRWSGPTFGEVFDQFFTSYESLTESLNKQYCYIFLLSHPENRLVCKIDRPKLTFLTCEQFNDNDKSFNFMNIENTETMICGGLVVKNIFEPLLNESKSFFYQSYFRLNNINKVISVTSELNWEEYTGLLLTRTDEKGRLITYKIVKDDYLNKKSLRGCEPNFRLRYLQMRQEGKSVEFKELFPEKVELFTSIDNEVNNDLPAHLKRLYFERYTLKKFIRLPREDHYVINKVFKDYISGKSILDNIKVVLSSCNGRQLNALLKHMKSRSEFQRIL